MVVIGPLCFFFLSFSKMSLLALIFGLAIFLLHSSATAAPTVLAAIPPAGLNKLCADRFIRSPTADCEYLLQAHPLYHPVNNFSQGAIVIDIFPVSGLPAFETVVNLPASLGGGQFIRPIAPGDAELAISNFTLGNNPAAQKTFVRYKQDSVYNDILSGATKKFPEEITFAIPYHLAGQLELAGDSFVAPNPYRYARYQNSDDQFTPLSLGLELGNMPTACIGRFTINDEAIPAANDQIILDMNCDNSVTQAENIYGCALKQRLFKDIQHTNFSAIASPVFENLLTTSFTVDETAFRDAGTGYWSRLYASVYGSFSTISSGIPRRDPGGQSPVWATITYRHPVGCLDPAAFGTNGPNSLQFVWTQGIDTEDSDFAQTALPALIRQRAGDNEHARIVYVPFLQGRPKIVRPFDSGILAPRVSTRAFCRVVGISTVEPRENYRDILGPTNWPTDQLFHLASVVGLPYSNVRMYAKFEFEYPYDPTLIVASPALFLRKGQVVQLTGARVDARGIHNSALVYYTGPLIDSPRSLLYEESTVGGENFCACAPSVGFDRCPLTPGQCPSVPGQETNLVCVNTPFLRFPLVNSAITLSESVAVSQDITVPSCAIVLVNGFDRTAGALINSGVVSGSNTILVNGSYMFDLFVYPESLPFTARWSVNGLASLQYAFSSPVAENSFSNLPTVNFSVNAIVPGVSMIAQVSQGGEIGSCTLDVDVDVGAPVAVLLPKRFAMTPDEALILLGNFSYQATGEPLTWSWRISSATARDVAFLSSTGNTSTTTFTATSAGTFVVTMTVRNPRNIERSVSASVIVQFTPINRTALYSGAMCVTSISVDPDLSAPLAEITDSPGSFAPVNTAPDLGVRFLQPGEQRINLAGPNFVASPGDPRRSPGFPDPQTQDSIYTYAWASIVALVALLLLIVCVFALTILANLCRTQRE